MDFSTSLLPFLIMVGLSNKYRKGFGILFYMQTENNQKMTWPWNAGLRLLPILLFTTHMAWADNLATPALKTAGVQAGAWQQRDEAFARVAADISGHLQLPYRIQVVKTRVHQGDSVNAGQPLLQFESPDLNSSLSAYQAAQQKLGITQKQLAYLQTIRAKQLIPRSDLFSAEQDAAQATSSVTDAWNVLSAQLNVLGETPQQPTINQLLAGRSAREVAALLGQLDAPFAGRVASRPPNAGYWVEANQPVMELESLKHVYVTVAIPPEQQKQWQVGKTQLLQGKQVFTLTPASQSPLLNPTTGMLELPFYADNPAYALQDGESLQAIHWGPRQPVFWVPASAVVARDGKSWCIVQQDKGGFKPVAVEAGQEQDGKIPVSSGLQQGQQVVTEGAYELLYRDINSLIQFVD
jgi:biotin carboxyl carrier protein